MPQILTILWYKKIKGKSPQFSSAQQSHLAFFLFQKRRWDKVLQLSLLLLQRRKEFMQKLTSSIFSFLSLFLSFLLFLPPRFTNSHSLFFLSPGFGEPYHKFVFLSLCLIFFSKTLFFFQKKNAEVLEEINNMYSRIMEGKNKEGLIL